MQILEMAGQEPGLVGLSFVTLVPAALVGHPLMQARAAAKTATPW